MALGALGYSIFEGISKNAPDVESETGFAKKHKHKE